MPTRLHLDSVLSEASTWTEETLELFDMGGEDASYCEGDLEHFLSKKSTVKATVIDIACNAFRHLSELIEIVRNQRPREVELFKSRLLDSKEEVIRLQKQIIELKDDSLEKVQSAVVSTVKSEFKSYSAAVGSGNSVAPTPAPAFSPTDLRKAMKVAADEEDRSRNVMLFGLRENSDESLEATVSDIFEEIGEKPRLVHVARVGKRDDGVSRPVLVTLGNSATAKQVLHQASGLKGCEKWGGRIYIGPDRTREERKTRKELVIELKKRKKENPNQKHTIRGESVVSSDV